MFNVGDVVKLNDVGLSRLSWWAWKGDEFRIDKFGRMNKEEFSCTSLSDGWKCVLTTNIVELIESLPINLDDFL